MNTLLRHIAHFDLDAFFVSVEILKNPSLKGKPIIVGGDGQRGIVAACSYEARKFGVRSAMPMKQAMQLCPQAILLKGTRGQYSRYSRWVTDIIAAKALLKKIQAIFSKLLAYTRIQVELNRLNPDRVNKLEDLLSKYKERLADIRQRYIILLF